MNKNFYSLGLMSGTSIDGIDASIIKSDGKQSLKVIDNFYLEYEESFRKKLKKSIDSCITKSRFQNQLKNIKKIEKKITYLHEKACKLILNRNKNINIDLIGFHGQTYLHKPQKKISIQIGNAELLFKLTGINIISHFRDNDILNGGEGAPLTPIYHKLILSKIGSNLPAVIINIGGISNITYLENLNENKIISFDTGPGNYLIDKWVSMKTKMKFDKMGSIAKSGKLNEKILKKIINNPYYKKKFPKSLDVKDLNLDQVKNLNLQDGCATLSTLTSRSIVKAIKRFKKKPKVIIISGGGRKNEFIIKSIKKLLNQPVYLIDKFNFNGDYIESQAFAYLAIRSYLNLPITFPNTTGVNKSCLGGKLTKI